MRSTEHEDRLIGLDTTFDPGKHVSGIPFSRFNNDIPSAGQDRLSSENERRYLHACRHFFNAPVEMIDGYGDFFDKKYYALEKKAISDALESDALKPDGEDGERITVDRGFRQFTSAGAKAIAGNYFRIYLITIILFVVDYIVLCALSYPAHLKVGAFMTLLAMHAISISTFWNTNSSIATDLGNTCREFFIELERELKEIADNINDIGSSGSLVPDQNARLAGVWSQIIIFIARRIEFGMRWFSIDVYHLRKTLTYQTAGFVAATLAVLGATFAASFGTPEDDGPPAGDGERVPPASAPDMIGDSVEKMINNGVLPPQATWFVFFFLVLIVFSSVFIWVLPFFKGPFRKKLNVGRWVKFSEIAIDKKIAAIVESDKKAAHKGSQAAVYDNPRGPYAFTSRKT